MRWCWRGCRRRHRQTVTATGTQPFTYQWRKDGTAIAGATNRTLTLANVTSSAAGAYTVVVTNAQGTATSSSAPDSTERSRAAPPR